MYNGETTVPTRDWEAEGREEARSHVGMRIQAKVLTLWCCGYYDALLSLQTRAQWFSKVHQNCPEGLIAQLASLPPQSFWLSQVGLGPQVVLMLLVLRPHWGITALESVWTRRPLQVGTPSPTSRSDRRIAGASAREELL